MYSISFSSLGPIVSSDTEGGTGDKKLICDRPFATLLRNCSSPRAPSSSCALLSRNSPPPVRRLGYEDIVYEEERKSESLLKITCHLLLPV